MKDTKQIVEEYLPKLIAACAIEKIKRVIAQNEDKWITVKPNGEENKGKHLLIKDGESIEDAMHRNGWYSKRQAKQGKKSYKNEIVKLQNKREELKKEFANADFTRKKEILEENNNILKQLWDLRAKETTIKREKLLKQAGNYKKTLEKIVTKNQNVINSLAQVQKDLNAAEEKWIELGKLKYQLWDDFKKLEKSQNISSSILKEKEIEYSKKVSE